MLKRELRNLALKWNLDFRVTKKFIIFNLSRWTCRAGVY